jgi:heme/copper-type cytochrome/quinol oxidase subunit 1
MSFRDYLHEKAEESRHNETLAYLMFLAGAVFFIGGVLETLSFSSEPSWFLFVPYSTTQLPGTFLGLALVIIGMVMLGFGFVSGLLYSHARGWYMQELLKANSGEEYALKQTKSSGRQTKRKLKAQPHK